MKGGKIPIRVRGIQSIRWQKAAGPLNLADRGPLLRQKPKFHFRTAPAAIQERDLRPLPRIRTVVRSCRLAVALWGDVRTVRQGTGQTHQRQFISCGGEISVVSRRRRRPIADETTSTDRGPRFVNATIARPATGRRPSRDLKFAGLPMRVRRSTRGAGRQARRGGPRPAPKSGPGPATA